MVDRDPAGGTQALWHSGALVRTADPGTSIRGRCPGTSPRGWWHADPADSTESLRSLRSLRREAMPLRRLSGRRLARGRQCRLLFRPQRRVARLHLRPQALLLFLALPRRLEGDRGRRPDQRQRAGAPEDPGRWTFDDGRWTIDHGRWTTARNRARAWADRRNPRAAEARDGRCIRWP